MIYTALALAVYSLLWWIVTGQWPTYDELPRILIWMMERWRQVFGGSDRSGAAFAVTFIVVAFILPFVSILYIGLTLSQLLS